MASTWTDPIQLEIRPDWRVLLFTVGVALLTTMLLGVAPAVGAARAEVGTALREGTSGMTASAKKLLVSKLFVVAQVALSLALVVGAGLFLRTLGNLKRMDLGYARERLLILRVDGTGTGYKENQLLPFYKRLHDALAVAPGVRSVALSENGLLAGTDSSDEVEVEGYTSRGKDDKQTRWDEVGPSYFATLRIPILLGRDISERDQRGSPLICVVNQAFAKTYFANSNPIGRHITTIFGNKRTTFEVIGVAKDTRDHRLRGPIPPRFFAALFQAQPEIPPSLYFEVRTASDPAVEMATLQRVIANAEPRAVLFLARSLTQMLDDRTRTDLLIARITSIFGGIALLLAAVGIYGVLAYAVSQRTSEIGIRMAVGARAATVIWMILKETGAMLLIGLTAGLVLAGLVSQLIRSQLVGMQPIDPFVFICAIGLILVLGIVAGYGPAWRASRIDPLRALRNE
jgi:predicted permease